LPNSRAMVLQQRGQCRQAGRMKGLLIPAETTRSTSKSGKGQGRGRGYGIHIPRDKAVPSRFAPRGSEGSLGRSAVDAQCVCDIYIYMYIYIFIYIYIYIYRVKVIPNLACTLRRLSRGWERRTVRAGCRQRLPDSKYSDLYMYTCRSIYIYLSIYQSIIHGHL